MQNPWKQARKPSVGLEPTTPSLPWKVVPVTGVHPAQRAGTKSLHTREFGLYERDARARGEASLMDPRWTPAPRHHGPRRYRAIPALGSSGSPPANAGAHASPATPTALGSQIAALPGYLVSLPMRVYGPASVRGRCELLAVAQSSFPRRQQHRRLRRAAASRAAGLAAGALALVTAAGGAAEVAAAVIVIMVALLIDARRWVRLAGRSSRSAGHPAPAPSHQSRSRTAASRTAASPPGAQPPATT